MDKGYEQEVWETQGQLPKLKVCCRKGNCRILLDREVCRKSGIQIINRQVSYTIFGDQWITYETPQSLSIKANYLYSLGINSFGFSTVEMDDFRDGVDQPFQLMKTVAEEVDALQLFFDIGIDNGDNDNSNPFMTPLPTPLITNVPNLTQTPVPQGPKWFLDRYVV
eukprot:TRINITY_DN7783_c0_g1_i3.p2 TRINITY_DN7783_c0_g1~~TRINITY_DN7783_c0_g1_i3.p2  ORF type:complete len:166 (-),score=14.04 TRINITY_DN7783_c0_g1_i3:6-503(-)